MMGHFFPELDTRQTQEDPNVAPTSTSQTNELVGELIWQNSLQQRTTTVVTISFNLLAAFLVIACILFDTRKASKRGPAPQGWNKLIFLSKIHPADTFPLAVSIAIAVQGLIFIGAQGAGLGNPRISDCRSISQIVWPALWIVAYTLVVFGIEVAFRGLQKNRFHPRGRYAVPICLSIILTMVLATWIPSQVYKNPKDECTASLLSWALPWADVALFLNSFLLFVYLVTGFLIAFQLSRTTKIDRNERIAASRTVYYLAIGVILMTCVLPLWAISVQRRSSNSAARAAAIALNIFGLLTGLLFLILRSNSKNMAFRPAAASWEQKQEWRLFGSPDIDIGKHLTDPVSLGRRGTLHEVVFPSSEKGQSGVQTSTLRAPSDAATDKETRPMLSSPPYRTPPKQVIAKPPLTSPPSYRAPPIPSVNDPQLVSPPTFQVPPQKPPSEALTQSINHASYTLFPHPAASTPSIAVNQVQSIERKPLDPGAPLGFGRHKFDTSDVTAATVQIGMRLSTGAIEPQMQEHIARSATYPLIISSSKPRPLNEVPQLKQRPLEGVMKPSLGPPIELGSRSRDSTPHEILFRLTSNEELSPEPVKTVALGGPKALDLISPTRGIALWRKFRDERMKSLPPVPVTPSQLQPPAGMRVSFSETRTPATEHGTLRSSQERTALSLALREDEEWPLQGVDMVLPDKSYTPNANRSWI